MHYFSLKSDLKTVKYLHRNLTLKIDIFVQKCIEGLTNSPSEKKNIEILISDLVTSLDRDVSILPSRQGPALFDLAYVGWFGWLLFL